MFKHILIATLSLFPALGTAGAALTDMETRWLKAAAPVLAYSQNIKLPIDIIVQPVARPNDVPMAVGFLDGRCKLVLSMRGNPDAEKVLDQIPQGERTVLMEAMAAHEIAHCWRYAQGAWHALPAGFESGGNESADQALVLNRREEGFADLVALAWTKRRHPDSYQKVYAWLATLRTEQTVAGGSHDTRAWVRLAADAAVFKTAATPFEEAGGAWSEGLRGDE
ncbi:MAG: hypothetical protein V4631_02150 [Pseudomonadota bacterium]